MSSFKESFEESIKAFDEEMKDALLDTLNFEAFSLEGADAKILKLFDMLGGVDVLCKHSSGIQTMAVRMQKLSDTQTSYKSFTSRYKRVTGTRTEYAKRIDAIINDSGDVYPYWTLQGYYRVNEHGNRVLVEWCVIKTECLYRYFNDRDAVQVKVANGEGNSFKIAYWRKLFEHGCRLMIKAERSGNKHYILNTGTQGTISF